MPNITNGIAIEPVAEPSAPILGQIFVDRQRVMSPRPRWSRSPDGGVMGGVRALPVVVGGERQHAADAADPIVERARAEKRAVAAIVLDHEGAHQKPGGGHGEQQGQEVADMHQRPHRRPQRRQRQQGDADLRQAARQVGVAVAREHAGKPLRGGQGVLRGRRRGRCRHRSLGTGRVVRIKARARLSSMLGGGKMPRSCRPPLK